MTDLTLPSDDTLTHDGLDAAQKGRFLVLACGALAREIVAVTKGNGFEHIDLQCLPALISWRH